MQGAGEDLPYLLLLLRAKETADLEDLPAIDELKPPVRDHGARPVGVEGRDFPLAIRRDAGDRHPVIGDLDCLEATNLAKAEAKGDIDEQHIKPEEAENRPRTKGEEV